MRKLILGSVFGLVLGSLTAGGPSVAAAGAGDPAGDPLGELATRLAAFDSHQPLRLEVAIEARHRGTAPLHLRTTRLKGKATVRYGERGVETITQHWLAAEGRLSAWKPNTAVEDGSKPLDDVEAEELANPAGALTRLLDGAVLLADVETAWQGQRARLLTIRPAILRPEGDTATAEAPRRLITEARIWLADDGTPLALERTFELRLGPVLAAQARNNASFQTVDGRFLVERWEESLSGTALALLHGVDRKTLRVSVAAEGRG